MAGSGPPAGPWVSRTTRSTTSLSRPRSAYAARCRSAELPRASVLGGQLADLVPVAQLAQLRPEPVDQPVDRLGRGQRLGVPAVVEQHAGQPAAGGAPQRGPVHRWRHRVEGLARLDALPGGEDRGAEQPGDQDGVVDQRAGIAGAQLEGGRVGRRADVEVGHLAVGDHTGADQVSDHLVVLRRPSRSGRSPRRSASAARPSSACWRTRCPARSRTASWPTGPAGPAGRGRSAA